ncbi:MAG: type II secretion system F family protein [Actinomycetota bacterium]|nr:type II secretion system F family protein [Actinomycetota bacterium]
MNGATTGAILGAALGTGLLLVRAGIPLRRRPSLDDRVLPYLAGLQPAGQERIQSAFCPSAAVPLGGRAGLGVRVIGAGVIGAGVVGAVVGPWMRSMGDTLGRVVGGAAAIQRRLGRAGTALSVEEFRIEQVTWGLLAAAATAAAGSMWIWGGRLSPAALLLGIVCAFAGGVLLRDQRLSGQVQERERAMLAEFPAIADLLALSVAAGAGPVSALERVAHTANGALASEFRDLLGDIAGGTPVVAALDALAGRTGVSAVARFASTLAVAVERGTPLVEVLHAQAADVREAGRRELLEAGARKEVLMMVPVVFLVLPVTVVFAFFPGVVGLQLTAS